VIVLDRVREIAAVLLLTELLTQRARVSGAIRKSRHIKRRATANRATKGPQAASGKAYNDVMSAKLASTNRYLRDAAVRRKLIFKSVASSSAIEGIRAPFKKAVVAKKAARAVKR